MGLQQYSFGEPDGCQYPYKYIDELSTENTIKKDEIPYFHATRAAIPCRSLDKIYVHRIKFDLIDFDFSGNYGVRYGERSNEKKLYCD